MNHSDEEKRYIAETKAALSGHNSRDVLAKIRELKTTGRVSILSYILDLLKSEQKKEIISEIFVLISDLKYQQGVPVVVECIKELKGSENLSGLISACWQSQLDYSHHLETFADCFISGSYQDAVESFTVIEEMLWRSDKEIIESCHKYLHDRKSKVEEEKQALLRELLTVLSNY